MSDVEILNPYDIFVNPLDSVVEEPNYYDDEITYCKNIRTVLL